METKLEKLRFETEIFRKFTIKLKLTFGISIHADFMALIAIAAPLSMYSSTVIIFPARLRPVTNKK